jgi:hypothetical protein
VADSIGEIKSEARNWKVERAPVKELRLRGMGVDGYCGRAEVFDVAFTRVGNLSGACLQGLGDDINLP